MLQFSFSPLRTIRLMIHLRNLVVSLALGDLWVGFYDQLSNSLLETIT